MLSAPEIITFPKTQLIGQHQKMTFAQNTTALLWQSFMLRRKEVQALNTHLFSVQVYPPGFFENLNPDNVFDKWAAVPVAQPAALPVGMNSIIIPEGLYAVFNYKGNPAHGAEVFRYIFTKWLPQSGYGLDNRPHFEILGERYKNGSDDSEEDIYIPVIKMEA